MQASPIGIGNRYGVLDALRGFALLGIILANSGYFSMYIFLSPEMRASMPLAGLDKGLEYFHLVFVDGKFYSIFSLLFGIGFYIFLFGKGQSRRIGLFYRRLFVLFLLGLAHSLLIWDGDILVFYALTGMLLPLFMKFRARTLVILWAVMVMLPLAFDALKVVTDDKLNISKPFYALAIGHDTHSGITQQNVSHWVLYNTSYPDLLNWNRSGVLWSWALRTDGNRIFKVLAMFLLGLAVGKAQLYQRIEELAPGLKQLMYWMLAIGLVGGALKLAAHETGRLPQPEGLLDTLAYCLNVAPLAVAYSIALALLYRKGNSLRWLEPMGRMALTNYMIQSVAGLWIYYGFGLGLATRMGPSGFIPIAIVIFALQVVLSHWWFRHFEFGPMEWLWRALTYGKRLPIRKSQLTTQKPPGSCA